MAFTVPSKPFHESETHQSNWEYKIHCLARNKPQMTLEICCPECLLKLPKFSAHPPKDTKSAQEMRVRSCSGWCSGEKHWSAHPVRVLKLFQLKSVEMHCIPKYNCSSGRKWRRLAPQGQVGSWTFPAGEWWDVRALLGYPPGALSHFCGLGSLQLGLGLLGDSKCFPCSHHNWNYSPLLTIWYWSTSGTKCNDLRPGSGAWLRCGWASPVEEGDEKSDRGVLGAEISPTEEKRPQSWSWGCGIWALSSSASQFVR